MVKIYIWGFAVSQTGNVNLQVKIDSEEVFNGELVTHTELEPHAYGVIGSFEVEDYTLASELPVELIPKNGDVIFVGFGWVNQHWNYEDFQLKQNISINGGEPFTYTHEDIWAGGKTPSNPFFHPKIVVGEFHLTVNDGQHCLLDYDFRPNVSFENPEMEDFF